MDKRREKYTKLLNAQADALAARILLDELLSGRIPNALELLEQRLDTSILIINSFVGEVEPSERASVVSSLRIVREYRQRHPRKTEAIFDVEDDSSTKHMTHKKVRKILDETLNG